MSDVPYYLTNVRAKVKVYGLDGSNPTELECTGFQLMFPFNGIPEATFSFAVGKNARDASTLAKVHTQAKRFKNGLKIEAFVNLKGMEKAKTAWPDGDKLVWTGITTGIGYSRSRQDMQFTIGSLHWLESLDAAAIASKSLWRHSADSFSTALTAGPNRDYKIDGALAAAADPTPDDLWAGVIKPVMKAAMVKDEHNPITAFYSPQEHESVWLQALQRLSGVNCDGAAGDALELGNEPAAKIVDERFNNAAYITPGKLDLNFVRDSIYADSINMTVAQVVASRLGSSTCWEKIQALTQIFGFAVCANVNGAATVPHIPFLSSKNVWRTIGADEYASIQGQGYTPRVLRGVALMGRQGSQTFAVGEPMDNGYLVGAYDTCKPGQIMFKQAPEWLLCHTAGSALTEKTARIVQPTATAPATGSGAKNPDDSAEKKMNTHMITEAGQQVGNRLARAYWMYEVFQARAASLKGRLRFDICPGSFIKVKGIGQNLPQYSSSSIYANVSAVKIIVDAQNTECSTTLYLSHIRTDDEESLSADTHPVYNTAWSGSKLADIGGS